MRLFSGILAAAVTMSLIGCDGSLSSFNLSDSTDAPVTISVADLNQREFHFGLNQAELNEADKDALLAFANYLSNNPETLVTIEGHADQRGSQQYNLALSEKRAATVADFLKSKGVADDQISIVSYGKSRLKIDDKSEEAFASNRRAVVVLNEVA